MHLPIRIRLSISYFVIFSLAGIILCAASYIMARRSLYVALDHSLDEHIDDVRDFIAAHALADDSERARQELADQFKIKDEGKWLQIADAKGHWIYRSPHLELASHGLPPLALVPRQGNFAEFIIGSVHVRSLCRTFTVQGKTFLVENGISLTKTNQTLLLYRNSMLLLLPAVFLMAGLTGHLISRRALQPVATIAREAQRIHDGNLQTRLPSLESRDELAHLSSTLNDMLERIESGVRSVRDFTAYASHELRTPLTLIRTEADLALRFERSASEYREAIAVISAEAKLMASLVDSLLFLARADAGAEQVQLQNVDAVRLCLQAYEKWQPLLAHTGVQLVADLPESEVPVQADPAYMQRLLTVILENAGKFTRPGGSVYLGLQVNGDSACFAIRDTGIGIPEQDRVHIFERFRRGGNVQSVRAQGSGLGLALAAWIASRHHTVIHVESEIGSGSSFLWKLPLRREPRALPGAQADFPARQYPPLIATQA